MIATALLFFLGLSATDATASSSAPKTGPGPTAAFTFEGSGDVLCKEIDDADPANFLFSPNMHKVALEQELWDGKGQLDFAGTFSSGEYGHKYYSGRRMWGSFHLLAPSAGLSPHCAH